MKLRINFVSGHERKSFFHREYNYYCKAKGECCGVVLWTKPLPTKDEAREVIIKSFRHLNEKGLLIKEEIINI